MVSLSPSGPEKGLSAPQSAEAPRQITIQPTKSVRVINALMETIETIEAVPTRVSEMTGEDRSSDMGGGGGSAAGQTKRQSPRDKAIANLPSAEVMQRKIAQHIQKEVKELEALAKQAKKTTKPGGAYYLNELYKRIRRLNSLLAELFEASVDVLKRIYVKVFVDKQSVI